ncbi:MAG: VWA domain-containing protein [Clostridia bacterium]|nr:VWA domain-containing protein [Clostridia bacterium]
MRKLLALMMAAMLALGMLGGLTGALAEVKNPGLDVVVVIDFSFSTFPGLGNNNPADPETMCLDAATMLINMCDAKFSKAAIVPFTDEQRFIDDYNASHGSLWKTWIDVSDPVRRRALCDSLYANDVDYASGANLHTGLTNYALGMQQALDLMSRSDTGNQKLVLVLGDGISKPASAENEQMAVDCARQIEAFGGRIYCMQFGNDPNGQNLLRSIATSPETYWSGVQPSELKDRFSGVFAELIGTEQETVTAQAGDGDDIVFDIRIPHKAITEVNVVVDRNKIEGGVSVQDNNGQQIGDGPNLIMYTNDHTLSAGSSGLKGQAYQRYDFVSLKIIEPDPGTWKVSARRAADVSADEQMTIDLLYNYQIELAAGLTGADDNAFRKNEHVTIESWFVDATGAPSSDISLYGGRQADGTGIEAVLTVYDANNNPVLETPMTADYDNSRFVCDIDLNTASFVNKNAADQQTFHYGVSASGDHLFRETENNENNVFVVFGDKPVATETEPQFLGTIRINDIFDENAPVELESKPLSGCFKDEDDDPLTYVIASRSGLEGEIVDNEKLVVHRVSDDNLKDGYVDVYAQDGAGNKSESVRFTANVISVGDLLNDCLTISADPVQPEIAELGTGLEPGQLGKGGSATVQVAYDLVPPSADFPYSELAALELRDKLDGVLAVEHVTVEKPKDAEVVNDEFGLGYTVSAKRNTGKVQVDSTYSINGGESKPLGSNTFEVVNVAPVVVEDLEGLLAGNGGESGEAGVVFTVDKDNPELGKLSHALNDWFTDADGAFDSLSFTASAENQEEEKDLFTPARAILRTFGLIAKEGPVVETNADVDSGALEGDTLNVTAARFGRSHVTVTATDEDDESVSYAIDYNITSSRDRLMCIITYAVILLILAVIAAVLINKYVVHRPWPRHNDEYRVTQNDFAVLSDEGKESRRFGRTRRKPCTLKVLADHFTIMDDGSGAQVFSKIQLWPTTGNRLVVELKKNAALPNGSSVKVDGTVITRSRKAKWCRNGRITVAFRDTAGNENTVVFKRD